jgi:hypothetical protein
LILISRVSEPVSGVVRFVRFSLLLFFFKKKEISHAENKNEIRELKGVLVLVLVLGSHPEKGWG